MVDLLIIYGIILVVVGVAFGLLGLRTLIRLRRYQQRRER